MQQRAGYRALIVNNDLEHSIDKFIDGKGGSGWQLYVWLPQLEKEPLKTEYKDYGHFTESVKRALIYTMSSHLEYTRFLSPSSASGTF
jgi:hypothetical protein